MLENSTIVSLELPHGLTAAIMDNQAIVRLNWRNELHHLICMAAESICLTSYGSSITLVIEDAIAFYEDDLEPIDGSVKLIEICEVLKPYAGNLILEMGR